MTIEALPAGPGDCLWIECHRQGRPWRLLFDGGKPDTWPVLRRRIERLDPDDRRIDLAVVSHIDSDHIGGMLPLLADDELGVEYGDVWFNGLPQLPLPGERRERSVAEGENLCDLLGGARGGAAPPWNRAFAGRAVSTGADGGVVEVGGRRADEPRISLLSPTRKRLAALRKSWVAAVDRLKRGEPEQEGRPPLPPEPLGDLEKLAGTRTSYDGSRPNGSSIAFLLEHRGASCLLSADAFVPVLGAALTALANARGGRPVEIDVFKLPHHGSKGNVSAKLLALAPARHYLVSTNGDHHQHPDDVALARVVTTAAPGCALWFNYTGHASKRWSGAGLPESYGYRIHQPGDGSEGIRLELPGRPGR